MNAEAGAEEDLTLTAGALRVELRGVDLFDLRWGGTQIAQRVYVAVRDAPWNTIPGVIERREVTQAADGFSVGFRCRHRYGEIDFAWDGAIEGSADGVLSYRMAGEALSDFEYSKIGLNIHHAIDVYRERGYSARAADGRTLTGTLPTIIEPQLLRDGFLTAMFDDFTEIEFDLDGQRARFEFTGDEFEMQDHRNWSDANYKIYGTPLGRGFPFPATTGERFEQSMRVAVQGSPAAPGASAAGELRLAAAPQGLPQIGHLFQPDAAGREAAAPQHPADASAALRPDFIRVEAGDLDAVTPALLALDREFPGADALIELAFSTTADDAAGDAERLAALLRRVSSRVARVIVFERALGFSATKLATPAELVAEFSRAFRAALPSVPILSGSEQNFNEINRSRPGYEGLDGIAFALNPQVHACDDVSLMQNAAGIVDIVETTHALYPGAEISVGPVRLIGPSGPFPAGPPAEGETGPAVDRRQTGRFGAAWAVAFLRSAAAAGVSSVSLYPWNGRGGILGSAVAEVLRRLREDPPAADARILVSASSNDRAACISWPARSGMRTLVANLRGEEARVRLPIDARSAKIEVLSQSDVAGSVSAAYATSSLELSEETADAARLSIVLAPFAVACVDSPSVLSSP